VSAPSQDSELAGEPREPGRSSGRAQLAGALAARARADAVAGLRGLRAPAPAPRPRSPAAGLPGGAAAIRGGGIGEGGRQCGGERFDVERFHRGGRAVAEAGQEGGNLGVVGNACKRNAAGGGEDEGVQPHGGEAAKAKDFFEKAVASLGRATQASPEDAQFRRWLDAMQAHGTSANFGSFVGATTMRMYGKGMAQGEVNDANGTGDGTSGQKPVCKTNRIKILHFADQTVVVQQVVSGNAEASYQDSPVTGYYAKLNTSLQVGPVTVAPSPEGIVVRKDNLPLEQAITNALNAMRSDGTYLKILTTWGQQSGVYPPLS